MQSIINLYVLIRNNKNRRKQYNQINYKTNMTPTRNTYDTNDQATVFGVQVFKRYPSTFDFIVNSN